MKKTLALLFVLTMSACQGDREIRGNLSESDANQLLVVLDSQKIPAKKIAAVSKLTGKEPSFSVMVKESKAAEALQILVDNKLPKPRSAGLGEIYPSDSTALIPSQSEERAKFLRAVQGEVENMLKVLPGVVEARVVLVVPEQNVVRDLRSVAPKATASVAVVYNPIDAEGTLPVKAEEIKYLVASSVENLSPTSVTVVMSENQPSILLTNFQKQSKRAVKKKEGKVGSKAEGLSDVVGTRANAPEDMGDALLIWLFGFLALAGAVLGIFGMVRNRSLRDQLKKALNAHAES